MKFYINGHIAELAVSEEMINVNAQKFSCLMDELNKLPSISYSLEGDSIFFKKKAWDSYEFANLNIACKSYNDSIVAIITPIDYYDTLDIKINRHPTPYKTTYLFKKAFCDTLLFKRSSTQN